MLLRKLFRFEASHILPKHPGKCARLHGHSWVLHVAVEGKINPETGFVMDYAEISEKVKPLVEALDHKHLGAWEIPWIALDMSPQIDLDYVGTWAVVGMPKDFYPSSENLLWWIGEKLEDVGLDWFSLGIEETCTSYAELTKKEFESSHTDA